MKLRASIVSAIFSVLLFTPSPDAQAANRKLSGILLGSQSLTRWLQDIPASDDPVLDTSVISLAGHAGGSATAIHVDVQATPHIVFAGLGRSLHIYRDNSGRLTKLGQSDLADMVTGIYAHNGYAYVTLGSQGLAVINVLRPEQPRIVAQHALHDTASNVVIRDNFAYVAVGAEGLAVVDISQPSLPRTVAYKDIRGYASDIALYANYALLASGQVLTMIDITQPLTPGEPVYIETQGAFAIAVSDNYAFVTSPAASLMGVAAVDLTRPTDSDAVSRYPIAHPYDVATLGRHLYVASSNGVAVFDITSPATPSAPQVSTSFAAGKIAATESAAFATTERGVARIDTALTAPQTPIYLDGFYAKDIYVNDNTAYIAAGDGGLAIVDISDPARSSAPEYVDGFSTQSVLVHDSYVYMATDKGLTVVNMTSSQQPRNVIHRNINGFTSDVAISGHYAFIAAGQAGLAVIDIADPLQPGQPIYRDTLGDALGVFVYGDYALVADGTSGLAIIDIRDPRQPGAPTYHGAFGYAQSVTVRDHFAYVADSSFRQLGIINIADPNNPGEVVYRATNDAAESVAIDGNYAFVSNSFDGVAIIDVTDPMRPGQPSYIASLDVTRSVFVRGNLLFAAASANGLDIFRLREE